MFEPGIGIKVELAKRGRTQVWLINELAARGLITDKSELSSVLAGARRGLKADLIINKAREVLSDGDGAQVSEA